METAVKAYGPGGARSRFVNGLPGRAAQDSVVVAAGRNRATIEGSRIGVAQCADIESLSAALIRRCTR